jgi:hypothetical protein
MALSFTGEKFYKVHEERVVARLKRVLTFIYTLERITKGLESPFTPGTFAVLSDNGNGLVSLFGRDKVNEAYDSLFNDAGHFPRCFHL